MKFNFILLKFDFLLLKFNFLLLKFNFLLLKFNFLLLKFNFLLLKFNFILLKINFLLLKFNFLLLKFNFLLLKIKFLIMYEFSIQCNYLCFSLLEVFPVMKFGELSIIGKDKNSQNLIISMRFITIIYIHFTVLFLIYSKYVNSLS